MKNNTIQVHNINALTCIDSATCYPEFTYIKNKTSYHVAKIFESQWLYRYPLPQQVVYDSGCEFTGHEFQELLNSYDIKPVQLTVKNPQANSLIERVHLTLADILRIHKFQEDPRQQWEDQMQEILQHTAFAIRATVNSTTGYSPGQLVFNRDMLLPFKVNVN